jgi:hypothetical protein
VQEAIRAGAILIKEGTILPEALQIESEPCVPGWGLVKDFDGCGLDRVIWENGWTFFCLAGEIRSIAFGIDEPRMVRRAIERILANPKSETYNSLEITRVASKRFLGVPYMSVGAQSRHIQESLFLMHTKGLAKPETGKSEPPKELAVVVVSVPSH